MPSHQRLLATCAVAGAMALVVGCAGSPPVPAKALPGSVPSLQVSLACNDCQVKLTVPELIRASYAAAAAKAGVMIDDTAPITLTVKEYSERNWAMRSVSLIAGPLAFMVKDQIKAVATVSNKQVDIDYFYRAPFAGIESVAQKIGELSFNEVTR